MQGRAGFIAGAGAAAGLGVAAVVTAPRGVDAWAELHAAYARFLFDVGYAAALWVPVGALVGWALAFLLIGRRALPSWRGVLPGAWLSIAPAAHTYGALLCLLSASRYSPKSEFIESGVAQLGLLGLAIWAGAAFATRHRRAAWIVGAYTVALIGSALLLLGPHGRAGFAHVLPLADILPRGTARVVTLIVAYTLLGGVTVWALREPKGEAEPAHRGRAGRALGIASSLLIAMLCCVAYVLTSQFDRRATTAATHLPLVFAVVAYVMAAFVPRPLSRWMRLVVAPAFLLAAAAYVHHLHAGGEDDPVRLMRIVLGGALGLAALLALAAVPWRRGARVAPAAPPTHA